MSRPSGIAVVATACRYPDAKDPDELWDSVLHQRRAFRAFPASRIAIEQDVAELDPVDQVSARRAGLIADWALDRTRHRISPAAYATTDVSHWLALDVADQLLANLDGWTPPAATTGVVLGNSLTGEMTRANTMRLRWPAVLRSLRLAAARTGTGLDPAVVAAFRDDYLSRFPEPSDETLAGSLSNTIAGRICNHFDFHGTGFTVDGACSSSLLSVVLACDALDAGRLDFAIAGGVDISLDPFELVGFARLGAISADQMRIYDERPTGFLPGEGCGMVGLMRLEDARAADLEVLGVVRGGASSSDGRGGLTRPDPEGHLLAARRAYANGGVEPDEIGLFEGHGTGTAVGDVAELSVFARLRQGATRPAAVGSVKANIGHTKAAAGVAGLLKALGAVHSGVLPPATGIERPHPLLRDDPTLVHLTEARPWTGPRTAGVSAMGFGGINTHVVVSAPDTTVPGGRPRVRLSARTGPREVWYVGAATLAGLRAEVERQRTVLGFASDAEVRDLALESSRSHAPHARHRLALAPADAATARVGLDELDALVAGGAPVSSGRVATYGHGPAARLGLVFPGQAAPRTPAGTAIEQLVAESAWAAPAVAAVTEAARQPSGAGTEVAQPSIVGGSLLGLAWLDVLGVVAHQAAGHSLGELSALAWAGWLEPVEAVRLAALRGRLMATHGLARTSMSSVAADVVRTRELLATVGDDDLVVAGLNSSSETVVAGPAASLSELGALARRRSVAVTPLNVSHAFHSPAMHPVTDPFAAALRTVDWSTGRPFVSTVTGDLVDPSGPEDLVAHLTRQLTEPVEFARAIHCLAEQTDALLECGPGRVFGRLAGRSTELPVHSLGVGSSRGELAEATAFLAATGNVSDLDPWTSARRGRPAPRVAPSLIVNPCGLRPAEEALAAPTGLVPGAAPSPEPTLVQPPVPTPAQGDARPGGRPVAPAAGAPEPPQAVVAQLVRTDAEPLPRPVGVSSGASGAAASTGATTPAEPAAALPTSDPAGTTADALAVLVELTADLMGLERDALHPDDSFAGRLHLNSLQVGQLVAAATARLGRQDPASPLILADATLRDAAAVLEELPAGDGDELYEQRNLATWVAQLVDDWQPLPVVVPGRTAPDARSASAAIMDPSTLVVELDAGSDHAAVAAVVARIASGDWGRVVVLHHPGSVGPAIARVLRVERPEVAQVLCVADHPSWPEVVATLAESGHAYADVAYRDGAWHERVSVPLLPAAGAVSDHGTLPVGAGDTLVVTGGLTGITAECAAELAARTGVGLVFVGRRDRTRVADRLADLARLGVEADYVVADLSDAGQVGSLVAGLAARGRIAGVVHGAGVNHPQALAAVDTASLSATSAPKAEALEHLLAAWPATHPPLLVVTFGSIIERAGLGGELDYAVANERLRLATERAAVRWPGCLVRHLEWSVWSGVGMGVSMQVLDRLERMGMDPVAPAAGRRAFVDALTADGPVTRLVTGRFAETPTLLVPPLTASPLRYCERTTLAVPGVQTVAFAELSTTTDLTLAEHRIDNLPVLPAVASLEAMAQVADETGGRVPSSDGEAYAFTEVLLHRAVLAAEDEPLTLRTTATRADDGSLRVDVSDDTTRYGQPDVEAVLSRVPAPVPSAADLAPRPVLDHLYGPLFFHGGPFRRVSHLGLVSASRLEAQVETTPSRWFSAFLPGELRLGDPGVLDATIHALQACHPAQRLLPVSAERVVVRDTASPGRPGLLVATEQPRRDGSDDLYFDVELTGHGGLVAWQGLRLRAVSKLPDGPRADPMLLGAQLARHLRETGLDETVDATLSYRSLTGDVAHTPGGRLAPGEGHLATSHHGGRTLTVRSARHPVGADLVPADGDAPALGPADRELAVELGGSASDALVVWAAREASRKAGHTGDFTLVARDPVLTLRSPQGSAFLASSGELTACVYLGGVR